MLKDMAIAKALLFALSAAGFRLYVQDGELYVEPPQGDTIGESLRAQLEQHHDALIEILAGLH